MAYADLTPEQRQRKAAQASTLNTGDPVDTLGQRYWPVQRFERPDGSFDVLAWCRELDRVANIGAGAPRA